MTTRPASNPSPLDPIDAGTRVSLDNAIAKIFALDGKHMAGETLTSDESAEYLRAHSLVNAFSGQVVMHSLEAFIYTPRGQRMMAALLPRQYIVQNVQAESSEKMIYRDPDTMEISRVVTRPLA